MGLTYFSVSGKQDSTRPPADAIGVFVELKHIELRMVIPTGSFKDYVET